MLLRRVCLGLVLCVPAIHTATTHAENKAGAVRVVFDTDISGDVDDVLALAMLHTLADRGECEPLAVTISKDNPLTGPFVDAVNHFYGRPDLPIGVARDAPYRDSKYLALVEMRDGNAFRYPHDLVSNKDAPDAVALLRRTLASQPDRSVALVQVGLAVNLAGLAASKPDAYSPLDGPALIRQKVRLVSVMAGAFRPMPGQDRFLEANVRNHVASMRQFAALWPQDVPVVWSGFEIGVAVPYPRTSIAEDFRYCPQHIVREAYMRHSGPDHDRPTWDLTSVLYAVRPDRGYFDLTPPGRVDVAEDGHTTFVPSEDGQGRDRCLVLHEAQAARVREALVHLVSQPPVGARP